MSAYPKTFRFTDGTETTIHSEAEHARKMIECRGNHEYVVMSFAGLGSTYGCWKCVSMPLVSEEVGFA